MSGLKLESYLNRLGKSQTEFAKDIGRVRSTINHWAVNKATVELTEIGIQIRMPNGLIVYESQVRK